MFTEDLFSMDLEGFLSRNQPRRKGQGSVVQLSVRGSICRGRQGRVARNTSETGIANAWRVLSYVVQACANLDSKFNRFQTGMDFDLRN